MGNLSIWDALKSPPTSALKQIGGGRLRGFTDVNPQWRYKAMTEQFGVCGVGWKYDILKLWLESAGDEVCAFAEVSLSIKVDGEWSDPIPGVGGSMILAKESGGLHVSDECYKMAITDALSVAMKMIGVAADIYAGLFDGSKYTEEKSSPAKKEDTRSHWCKEHETAFFKTDLMKSFAHPIGLTREWCYEHTEKPPSSAPPADKRASNEPPKEPMKNLGELYTLAGKYGISRRDVCEANGVGTGEELTDLDAAWEATATKFATIIKTFQEKAKS